MTKLLCFCCLLLCVMTAMAAAQTSDERGVDPTFLHRYLPQVKEARVAISSSTARYKPLFGEGDSNSKIVKGVSRFGEITVDPNGSTTPISYPREEHIVVVLEGEGTIDYANEKQGLRKHDFLYVPPGIKHSLTTGAGKHLRAVLMGFKIPDAMTLVIPPKLLIANIDDVKKQVVGNHPPSTLYQLLIGDTKSTRDRLAAGHIMKSLFVMEFTQGGTNFPHHHEREEEIYLLLDGEGEMVAGGGTDGIEGRYPARPGDAYFYRVNTTVGFYNSNTPNAKTAHILAVRSSFPFNVK